MERFYYIILTCAIYILSSCSGTNRNNSIVQIYGYDTSPIDNGKGIDIKDFKAIPLETTKESLVIAPIECAVYDSCLIIKSQTGLKCFDLNGHYKFSFGSKGKGRGEYVVIDSYYVDETEHKMNIIDRFSKKILTYDLNGKYLSTQKIPGLATHNTYKSHMVDNQTLIMANYITGNANCIYSLFDLNSLSHSEIYTFPVNSDNSFEKVGNAPISISKGGIKIIIPFDNVIYQLSREGLAPVYKIETKQQEIEMSEIKRIKDFSIMSYVHYMDKDRFIGFTDILETELYTLLGFMNLNYFLIKNGDRKGVLYNYKVDMDSALLPLINITSTYNDYFIGSCSAVQLKEVARNVQSQYNEYLSTISQNISESDNPVILFYNIK